MGTKDAPGKFDCYAKAKHDEPMFTLLARDPLAPLIVEAWAKMMEDKMMKGHSQNIEKDRAKILEARACAAQMRVWEHDWLQFINRPPGSAPPTSGAV